MYKLAAFVVAGLLLQASSALAGDEPQVVRARVVSYESAEDLSQATCGLVAIANVGGHARLFDVAIDGKRCSSLALHDDAVPLRVHIESRADGMRDIVFEADVREDTTAKEMSAAVDGTARELFERLGGAPHRTTVPVMSTHESTGTPSKNGRGGGIALMALGGVSLSVAAVVGAVAFVEDVGHAFGCSLTGILGGPCPKQDLSAYGIGAAAAAGLGAVLMITGGVVLSFASPKSAVSAQLGPTGGSLRFVF